MCVCMRARMCFELRSFLPLHGRTVPLGKFVAPPCLQDILGCLDIDTQSLMKILLERRGFPMLGESSSYLMFDVEQISSTSLYLYCDNL